MSDAAELSTGNEELWSIVLPTGAISQGTLDQLDEAFQAGHINGDTLVLAPGATEWSKLGDLAGIDTPAATAPADATANASVMTADSLRPIMSELDPLDAEPPFRRKGKGRIVAIVAALGVIGAAAFAMTRSNASSTSAPSAATAPQPESPLPAAPPPAAPVAPIASDGSSGPKLTDAQRKALADMDQKHAAETDAHKKARLNDAPTHKASKGVRDSDNFASPRKSHKPCTCKAGDPLCSCL